MALQRIKPSSCLQGLAQAAGIAAAELEAVIAESRKPCFYVSEGRIFERGIPMPVGLEQAQERAALILEMAMDPAWEDDFSEVCMRRLADLVAAYREVTQGPPPVAPALRKAA